MSPQSFEQLLQRISDLLQEKDTIRALWPEAENYADSDLFDHLHIEFDSTQKSVKLATAGTGYNGKPLHDYEYSLSGEITAEPAKRLQAPNTPTAQPAVEKQNGPMQKFQNFFFDHN